MAWMILIVAGLFEAGMVLGLDSSEGFTKLWTAIGASLAVLLGILFLGEPANLLRLTGIVVVLGGVLLLRFAEG